MRSETKTCQNCKQPFTIEPEDFSFYEKIGVPPPTWCPECRNIRRMAWREHRTLHKSTCKLCGKSVVSIHDPAGPFTVYCRDCWHSDKWDSLDYGRNYDFSRPFFTQYRELMEAVPRPALTGTSLVNSDFTHGCQSCKNCYFVFWSYFTEDSQYCDGCLFSRNTYDAYTADNSDHAYEALHSNRLYRVRFGYFADDCLDSALLFNCLGCSDCFGCVNLRKQKYHLWNQPLSKEEYKEKVKYWDLGSYARLEEAKKKFRDLYLSLPHRSAHILSSQNVTGDIIRDTKDCQFCFSTLDGVQNSKYLYFAGLNLKDSYDVTGGGATAELLYEIFAVTEGQRCFFSVGSGGSQNILYCDWVSHSSDMFGCIAIKSKKHCIFNKQYTREEYKALKDKIRQQMMDMPYVDAKGREYRFGEFFPSELSAYPYDDSYAASWYPKSKEEVLAEGWRWRNQTDRSYEITKKPEDLPDHINNVPDSIVDDVIGCMSKSPHFKHDTGWVLETSINCSTAFRITREELAFYRAMNIALPRFCYNCRHDAQLRWRNGYNLYHRRCECSGEGSAKRVEGGSEYKNTATHFHGTEKCPNEFETTYPPADAWSVSDWRAGAPEKPEIIYCEQCYKAEFL